MSTSYFAASLQALDSAVLLTLDPVVCLVICFGQCDPSTQDCEQRRGMCLHVGSRSNWNPETVKKCRTRALQEDTIQSRNESSNGGLPDQ